MADSSFELEEMLVRFTADTQPYVNQVKEVQKVTQEAAAIAKQTVQVYQDGAGRWRNARGQFATASELREAAMAARASGQNSAEAKAYAAQLDKVAESLGRKTAKQSADTKAVKEAAQEQSALSKMLEKGAGFIAPVVAGLSIGGMASTIAKSVSLAAESESVSITFDTIIGDGEKAKKVLSELRAFADWSPFNTGEVMEAGKMMLAMGTSADTLVGTMTTMGDVAGALNIPIKDLTYLMGTLQSVGRATTVDLNQFALRGIPIWRELATMMYGDPKAVAKVRQAVEAGQVSFDVVDKAFKKMTSAGGMFYQGMEKQAKGLSGLWATFQSETENTLRAFGEEIVKNLNLKWVVQQVTDLTKAFTKFFTDLTPETKRFIVFTVLAIAGILGIAGAIAVAGTIFNTMFGGMGLLIGVLVTLAVATAAWASSLGTLEDVWREVVYNAQQFYNWIKPLLPLMLTLFSIGNPVLGMVILLIMYWKEVSAAVQAFGKWVEPILRELKYTIINLATVVKDVLVAAWKWATDNIVRLWKSMTGDLNIDWATVQAKLSDLMVFFEFMFHRFDLVADVAWKAIKFGAIAAFNWIVNNVFMILAVVLFPQILIGMVVNWKEMLTGMAVAAVMWGIQMKDFFKSLFESIVKHIASVIGADKIVGILTGQLKIEDVLKDAFEGLGNEVIDNFKKHVAIIKGMKVTMTGIKVEGLDKAQADAKKELDDALGKMNAGFGEFKTQRNAKIFFDSLKSVGYELFKAGLAPSKDAGTSAGAEAGKSFANAMAGEIKKHDAVIKGSIEEAIRTDEYLEYLKNKRMDNKPQLPFGAVPPDQWKPPVQASDPMGAADKDRSKVIELLSIIAGGVTKLENKAPAVAGPAGL